jgi:hypothetical protein
MFRFPAMTALTPESLPPHEDVWASVAVRQFTCHVAARCLAAIRLATVLASPGFSNPTI